MTVVDKELVINDFAIHNKTSRKLKKLLNFQGSTSPFRLLNSNLTPRNSSTSPGGYTRDPKGNLSLTNNSGPTFLLPPPPRTSQRLHLVVKTWVDTKQNRPIVFSSSHMKDRYTRTNHSNFKKYRPCSITRFRKPPNVFGEKNGSSLLLQKNEVRL